jgi:hypothetical protein
MYDQPWQQTPANRPEERLLRRLYRVFTLLDVLYGHYKDRRRRVSQEFMCLDGILQVLAVGIESQVVRPNRLRTWLDSEGQAKLPPASVPLLVRLLRLTRKAAADLLQDHNLTAQHEGLAQCACPLCYDVYFLRWALGKARRAFVRKEVLS